MGCLFSVCTSVNTVTLLKKELILDLLTHIDMLLMVGIDIR